MKCPHHYHLAVLKEKETFSPWFLLNLSVISGLHFLCCWSSQCVQTWLCGRSAIRCAPLTAQIITIHHLFTLSFGKSSCFTPWNYNLSPRPRKVNVSCVLFFLACTLKMLSQVRIDLWSVTHFRWHADGRSLFCLWFTPCLFLFVKMWRWKGDARIAGGLRLCKNTVGLMLQGEAFDDASDLCHWKRSQTQAQVQ